jgi:hypothetical protein
MYASHSSSDAMRLPTLPFPTSVKTAFIVAIEFGVFSGIVNVDVNIPIKNANAKRLEQNSGQHHIGVSCRELDLDGVWDITLSASPADMFSTLVIYARFVLKRVN